MATLENTPETINTDKQKCPVYCQTLPVTGKSHISPSNSIVNTNSVSSDPIARKGFLHINKLSYKYVVILLTLLVSLLSCILILMVVFLFKDNCVTESSSSGFSELNITRSINATKEENYVTPETHSSWKIVPRLEWLAQAPMQPSNPLQLPVSYVIISHTATASCSSVAQCIVQVRLIQTFHMESKNWWDIGYNFLVGGDGRAYEGRGWRNQGAHTYGFNSKSIGIAFIGTFHNFKPPQDQIQACKKLIDEGVKLGYINKDYKILAQRQVQTTESPGTAFYEELKTWNHWSNTP